MKKIFGVEKLSLAFDGKKVLEDIGFEIFADEVVTILGASGVGKTSLFRILMGVEEKYGGQIVDGYGNFCTDIAEDAAYMMQKDNLLPWKTLWENLFVTLSKKDSKASIKFAEKFLIRVGLSEAKNLYPHELSCGMKKRASLVQALLQRKNILLLDEPFNGVDIVLKESIYSLINEMRLELSLSVLLITHDFFDAFFLSDKIMLLAKGSIVDFWEIPRGLSFEKKIASSTFAEVRKAFFSHSPNFIR